MSGLGQGALGDLTAEQLAITGHQSDEVAAVIAVAVERLRRPARTARVSGPASEALDADHTAPALVADARAARHRDDLFGVMGGGSGLRDEGRAGVLDDGDAVTTAAGADPSDELRPTSALPRTAALRRLVGIVADAPVPLTVTQLGTRLGVDQPRASRLVSAAVSEGLVMRTVDPDDARCTRIELGESGKASVAHLRARRTARAAAALESFSAEEREQFAALLTRFASAYRA